MGGQCHPVAGLHGGPIALGILIVGGVTLVYSTVGGLWADALTDFGQFIIQLVAGIAMFVLTAAKLGTVFGISNPAAKPFFFFFFLVFLRRTP